MATILPGKCKKSVNFLFRCNYLNKQVLILKSGQIFEKLAGPEAYSDMGQVYLKVLKYKYFRILYVQDKHLQSHHHCSVL